MLRGEAVDALDRLAHIDNNLESIAKSLTAICNNITKDCENCPRLMDDCDGNDEFLERLEENYNEFQQEGKARPII